jgi:hypothetical protein
MICIENYQNGYCHPLDHGVGDSLTHSSHLICNFLTTLSNPKPYSNKKSGDNKIINHNNVNRVSTDYIKLHSWHLSAGPEKEHEEPQNRLCSARNSNQAAPE